MHCEKVRPALYAQILACLLALGAAGCTTRPLPGDYVGPPTISIVKKIRCEAREAVIGELAAFLLRPVEQDRPSPSVIARFWGEELRRDPSRIEVFVTDFKTIKPQLDAYSQHGLSIFDDAAIAYDFKFNINEGNDVGAGLNLLRPLAGGTIGLGLNASATLDRTNERAFRLKESYRELIGELKNKDCADLAFGLPGLYPITGQIGLREMFQTFRELRDTGTLTSAANPKFQTLSDTLTFTSVLTMQGSAGLTLRPAGRRWQLTNLGGALQGGQAASVNRSDTHQLAMSLTIEDDGGFFRATASGKKGAIKSARAERAKINATRENDAQRDFRFLDSYKRQNERLGLPPL